MYRLDSLYDRIRLEEAARAQAREYIRDEGIPVWQIDPDELARRVIARAIYHWSLTIQTKPRRAT